MSNTGCLAAGVVIDQVLALLDRVDPARGGLDGATRLSWVRSARRAHERLGALMAVLVGEADRAQAAERSVGTPLSGWLGTGEVVSRREAAAVVRAGRELAAHPELADAATAGRVSTSQSRAIGRVLGELAPQLDPSQQAHAERVLVEFANRMDADQLRHAAGAVLARVAPVDADELLETKLQREHEAAVQGRSFRYYYRAGSLLFEGSLPRVDGAQFVALIDAHSEKLRRTAVEAGDRLAAVVSPEQRRADALASLVRSAAEARPDPGLGAARVVVSLSYDELLAGAAGAGLIGRDVVLSAGELRRVCCGAGLVPVVLGGESEPLDVGRSSRLVTAAQRVALTVRDGGCAFPGCDALPVRCEAHHIEPWWCGGRSDLSNLVLLCRHHHGLIEPARYGLRDQWEVRIAADGLPEFLPPRRYDHTRRPLRNRDGPDQAPAHGGETDGVPARGGGVPACGGDTGGVSVRGGDTGGVPACGGEAGGASVCGGEAGGVPVRGGEAGGASARESDTDGVSVRGGEADGVPARESDTDGVPALDGEAGGDLVDLRLVGALA